MMPHPSHSSHAGGCACGRLRYAPQGLPVYQGHCQCRDCQWRSGTGHSSWLVFLGDPDSMVQGPYATWLGTTESGQAKCHGFCPTCGTSVFLTFAAMPGIVAVTAGSLDDPAAFGPTAVTWTRNGHRWDSLDSALTFFDQMPPPPEPQ